MERNKLQKLQTHLKTLKLFKVKKNFPFMSLPKKNDMTRFAMYGYEFNCGMPACVAGHAKYIFNWGLFDSWDDKFESFFGLTRKENDWITDPQNYKSFNPTTNIAAKHIQDVLDGKI